MSATPLVLGSITRSFEKTDAIQPGPIFFVSHGHLLRASFRKNDIPIIPQRQVNDAGIMAKELACCRLTLLTEIDLTKIRMFGESTRRFISEIYSSLSAPQRGDMRDAGCLPDDYLRRWYCRDSREFSPKCGEAKPSIR